MIFGKESRLRTMGTFRVQLSDPTSTDNVGSVAERRDRFVARAREIQSTLSTCALTIVRQSADGFAFDVEGTREGIRALQAEHADVIASVKEIAIDTIEDMRLTLDEKRTESHQHRIHG